MHALRTLLRLRIRPCNTLASRLTAHTVHNGVKPLIVDSDVGVFTV